MKKVAGWYLPAVDTHFENALLKNGNYLIDRLHKAMDLVKDKESKVALDIGAHCGLWAKVMTEHFRYVHAFEPARDSFQCLMENLEGCHNVTMHCTAVGEGLGRGRMYDDTSKLTRIGNTGARFWKPDPDGDILMTYIDRFRFQDVGFVKIDVEGQELYVLKGAKETFEKWHPTVILEIGKAPPDRYGLDDKAPIWFLEHMGYREALRMKADRVFIWN